MVLAKWVVALSMVMSAGQAAAWGAKGHQIVATLAEERLDARTAAEVRRLLKADGSDSLAAVSTWADEIKDRRTARWHFVNFEPGSCRYNEARQCRGGECAVVAVQEQLALLGSARPDADRVQALKFVVHLVADLHQPLHAGFAEDKGGNDFQVRWDGKGSNLHAVWDSGLIDTFPGGARGALAAARRATKEAPSVVGGPRDWAEASCRVVQSRGFYPSDRSLPEAYRGDAQALAVMQLDRAAWALAAVLRDALGGK